MKTIKLKTKKSNPIEKGIKITLVAFFIFTLIKPFIIKAYSDNRDMVVTNTADYIKEFKPLEKEGEALLKELLAERAEKLKEIESKKRAEIVLKSQQSPKIDISTINASSPLVGYEQFYIDYFKGDVSKARLMIAITGAETNFGTAGVAMYYNPYAVYNSRIQSFDWGWISWDQGIKNGIDLVDNYVWKWDGNLNSLESIFIGQGKYCTSGCSHWIGNVTNFYNKLSK